jgi:hypothetical protein
MSHKGLQKRLCRYSPRASLKFLYAAPELRYRVLQVRAEDFGHAVKLVETAYYEILDKARAIDTTELLVSFVIRLKRWPAVLHVA